MYKVIKFWFGTELNNTNGKTYITKQYATNAGNSWQNDCTVDQNERKGRCFEVVEVK